MSELVVIEKPNSYISEEIKKIRTNLKFSAVTDDIKVVMITSSVPGEGKSFISANLAVAFAQNGERVLIVDCDLRKGRQKKIFEITERKSGGFSSLLINKNWEEEYKKYVRKTKVDNLYIIPSGPFPPNPSELLSSERCKKTLEKLKTKFDIIILDCPPLVGLNDTLVISSYADISIIVARHKKTPMDLLEKSKKSLETVGAKKLSVILNQIDTKVNPYYYGHYYRDK